MNLNPCLQFRRFLFPSSLFRCLLPCSVKRPSPSATIVTGSEAPPPPSSLSPRPTYLSVPDLNVAANLAANLFSHRCSLSSSWISIRISPTPSAADTPPRYYRRIGYLPQPKLARACSYLCLESWFLSDRVVVRRTKSKVNLFCESFSSTFSLFFYMGV
jgi:hypothetical protein